MLKSVLDSTKKTLLPTCTSNHVHEHLTMLQEQLIKLDACL